MHTPSSPAMSAYTPSTPGYHTRVSTASTMLPTPPREGSSTSERGTPSPYAPSLASVVLPTPAHRGVPYGLMTPPASPARPSSCHAGAPAILHPLLSVQHATTSIYFDLRLPTQQIQLFHAYAQNPLYEPATRPPTSRLLVGVLDVVVEVAGARGAPVTVLDVLNQIAAEMTRSSRASNLTRGSPLGQRPATPRATRKIDMLGRNVVFAGLELAVLNGAECWVLRAVIASR
ncbi:hypothetical protein OBBRIDRAFT_885079 [Obba rivulosa]|uniref:DUF6699 domain-containing protein n=1 Tax=Obba rivulosa TaxID=1052685 RepID=A0A8E2DQL7_9APHY|nr:hypothetical protein OBBRIDRAFT_885079 [Obba rivulosa]